MVKKTNICKNLTYDDCELTILRQAVDEAEKTKGREKLNSPELKKIIEIVENFFKGKTSNMLRRNCYKQYFTKI